MSALVPLAQVIEGELSGRAQLIAVIGTILFLAFVIELVRQRRLVERYALLWMSVAMVGVILAVWNGGLNFISERLGIASPPNALFLIGLVAIFGLLLNFSAAISRLSEETKILAQTVSRLDAELRDARGEGPRSNGGGSAGAPAEDVSSRSGDGQGASSPAAERRPEQSG